MNYRVIDLEHYPRKNHFLYFRDMANPYVGITVEVDITRFHAVCKDAHYPFFLSFLYCIGRAANAVPQFRQRIVDGMPVEFDRCDTSHTEMRADETYGYCQLNCMQPFESYLSEALQRQQLVRRQDDLDDGGEPLSLLFISSVPWLHYIDVQQPTPIPADSNPRILWGKFTTANDKTTLPVTVLANHALVDGIHFAKFFSALEDILRTFPNCVS